MHHTMLCEFFFLVTRQLSLVTELVEYVSISLQSLKLPYRHSDQLNDSLY